MLHAGRKHRRGSEKEKYGINDIVQPKKNLGRQFAWHGGSELVQHHHIKQARSFHEGLYNINRENSDYGTASRWMSPISAEGRENSRLGRGNDSERNLIRDGATSRYVCLKGLLEVIGIMSYLLSPKAILQSESRTLEKPIQQAQRP